MLLRLAPMIVVSTVVGCAREVPRGDLIVIEVAGIPVTVGELERFLETSVQQESPVLSPEVMSALFDQFVEEQLLLRAAQDAGIEADPRAVAERLEALRTPRPPTGVLGADPPPAAATRAGEEAVARSVEKQMRIERLVETEALAGVDVGEDEVAAYYDARREDYVRPETVDVSQILVATEEIAREIRQALVSRKSTFEDMAREHSEGPEAGRGGHLGAFARGELPPSFEAEVFALRPGAISEVVATDFGYHIFRSNAKADAQPLAFEDVREVIRVELLRQKSDAAMERFVDELEKRYPVKVYHEQLSFAVAGRSDPGAPAGMEKSR